VVTRNTRAGLLAGLLASLGAVLVVGLFAAASLLAHGGSVGPAMAGFTTTPSPTPTGDPSSDGGDPKYGTVKNCAIVSSSSYLGMSCAGADNGGKTVKQILGPSDVPVCWDEPLTEAELVAMNVENKPGPDGWTYYWEKCLSGIDKKTKTIEPGGVSISLGLKRILAGDAVKTLDNRQWQLVKSLSRNGNIPVPVAGVSPADHPRVGVDVAFFDGTDDELEVAVGGVVLRAHIESLDIEPLGPGAGDTVSCPGSGLVAQPGDSRTSRPRGCWHRYVRSSAGQPYDEYPVQITAHWTVEVSADGGATFSPFNRFTRSAITRVPVTEVQALVVQ
jgi:hypothetical protein